MGVNSTEVELYAKKIEYLVSNNVPKYVTKVQRDPRAYLARLYNLGGKEEAAKNILNRYIRNALDILSDEDPDNDNEGFDELAVALSRIDREHAIAAWSLLGHLPTESFTTAEGDEENKTKQVPAKARLSYYCDGGCGHVFTCGSDMYICLDCLDVQFNSPCYEKFIREQKPLKSCKPSHEFFYIPKCDESDHDGSKHGTVKVNGEVRSISDWLDELRGEYIKPAGNVNAIVNGNLV